MCSTSAFPSLLAGRMVENVKKQLAWLAIKKRLEAGNVQIFVLRPRKWRKGGGTRIWGNNALRWQTWERKPYELAFSRYSWKRGCSRIANRRKGAYYSAISVLDFRKIQRGCQTKLPDPGSHSWTWMLGVKWRLWQTRIEWKRVKVGKRNLA